MIARRATAADLGAIERLHVAEAASEIVGVVRLCEENEVLVLRGMYLLGAWQRKGVGSRLLDELVPLIGDRPCWCVAYRHPPGH